MNILLKSDNILEFFAYLHEGMFVTDTENIIQYWNNAAEKITGYQSMDIIGKQCCDSFLIIESNNKSLCTSRSCTFIDSLLNGKRCRFEAYLQHKDGYRIPVSLQTLPLYDNQKKIIGVAHFFLDNSPREFWEKELAYLQDMSTIDALTGLRNRRYAEIVLNSKLDELRAGGMSIGVLFIDIDNFKNVNDNFGHDVGDSILKMIAKTILNNTREPDTIVRWGGEELIAIIISNGIQHKLYKIAEKIRKLISQSMLPLEDGSMICVTVSIGATTAYPSDTVDTLIKRADHLMYQAKHEGKNCVKMS